MASGGCPGSPTATAGPAGLGALPPTRSACSVGRPDEIQHHGQAMQGQRDLVSRAPRPPTAAADPPHSQPAPPHHDAAAVGTPADFGRPSCDADGGLLAKAAAFNQQKLTDVRDAIRFAEQRAGPADVHRQVADPPDAGLAVAQVGDVRRRQHVETAAQPQSHTARAARGRSAPPHPG